MTLHLLSSPHATLHLLSSSSSKPIYSPSHSHFVDSLRQIPSIQFVKTHLFEILFDGFEARWRFSSTDSKPVNDSFHGIRLPLPESPVCSYGIISRTGRCTPTVAEVAAAVLKGRESNLSEKITSLATEESSKTRKVDKVQNTKVVGEEDPKEKRIKRLRITWFSSIFVKFFWIGMSFILASNKQISSQ